ncbi:MAG: hypothetical protein HYX93_02460 [Chloroflexi bacterium]|nr:hypothetical protein [Chloroflexota bacterium]
MSAANGAIGATTIPVSGTSQATAGGNRTVTVSQNVPGTAGVNGSGTLATLTFTFAGKSGDAATTPSLETVSLSNASATTISANTVAGSSISSPVLRGDADGDGTLNVLDITKVELVVAGAATAGTFSLTGANADASGTDDLVDINALDITKTEILVAAG